jgi:polyisoprenoid-binding protein YceI
MLTTIRRLGLAVLVVATGPTARAADVYAVDPVHSSISFKISHIGISNIHGRFDDFGGAFTIDKDDPAKSSFTLSIPVVTVDTNNVKRDEHLRNADFFNAKQFPLLTFQSTAVKPVAGGFDVAGDLTLHGVKKPVTFTLKGGDKTVEFPKGMQRIGFTTTLTIKRSDFDMKAGLPSLGDEVLISIAIEAAKE